jgi:hypothetical protein
MSFIIRHDTWTDVQLIKKIETWEIPCDSYNAREKEIKAIKERVAERIILQLLSYEKHSD